MEFVALPQNLWVKSYSNWGFMPQNLGDCKGMRERWFRRVAGFNLPPCQFYETE